jgi:glycosyltransferase involved in cell wall biosynthesis
MQRPRIVANCVVRNEEKWVWYSLLSAINFVDEILVWDTGSTDSTAKIVKQINSPKIKFKQLPPTKDETDLSQVRQQMLEATKADWLFILDGDEIWPDDDLNKVIQFISTSGLNYDSIVAGTINCVGDVYHAVKEKYGRYNIAGHRGHLNLRFINLRRVQGLAVTNPPGQFQSYVDSAGVKVQDRDWERIAFLSSSYLHMTHLNRSNSRIKDKEVFWRGAKRKFEFGKKLITNFRYPSCFYLPHPLEVASPWNNRSWNYYALATLELPFKSVKRFVTNH